jgi:hypothetical protein
LFGAIAFGQAPPATPPKPAQAPAPPTQTTTTPAPAAAPATSAKPPLDGVDDMFSLGIFYWRPGGTPGFRGGKLVPDPTSSYLNLTDNPNRGNGFILTVPTGHYNRLDVSYWRLYDSGDVRSQNKISIFGANIQANERLNTTYKISNVKVAWNYLTFPAPPFDSKLRIKTFWEVQWTQMNPTIYFPDAKNSPAPINPKQSLFLPGGGLGLEYIWSKKFRVEAHGSGMGFPNKSAYYDIEGSAVGRIKKVEIFASMKGYHFRTSPKQTTFIKGTYWGPSFGIRYVFR